MRSRTFAVREAARLVLISLLLVASTQAAESRKCSELLANQSGSRSGLVGWIRGWLESRPQPRRQPPRPALGVERLEDRDTPSTTSPLPDPLTPRPTYGPAQVGSPSPSENTQLSTTTTLSISSNDAIYGTPITLTATVLTSSGDPVATGYVHFVSENMGSLGVAYPDGNGVASATLLRPDAGVYGAIKAVFSDWGTDYAQSESTSDVSLFVAPVPTTLTLTAGNISRPGETSTFGVNVSSTNPGSGIPPGTVELYDGDQLVSSLPLFNIPGIESGYALFGTPLAAGRHTLVARYVPSDANFLGAQSTPLDVTITVPTSIFGYPNQYENGLGSEIGLSAGVRRDFLFPIVEGQVEFSIFEGSEIPEGATPIYSTTSAVDSSGNAYATVPGNVLGRGTYTVRMTYSNPDGFNATSVTSANFSVTAPATQLALQASPETVTVGASTTVTATVRAAVGDAVPTGQVTFMGPGEQVLGTVAVDAEGKASLVYTPTRLGYHSIWAYFSNGADEWSPSGEGVSIVAAPAADAFVVSPTTAVYGAPVRFSASISGEERPRGEVDFYAGTTFLGRARLRSDENDPFTATVMLDSLAPGTYTNLVARFFRTAGGGEEPAAFTEEEGSERTFVREIPFAGTLTIVSTRTNTFLAYSDLGSSQRLTARVLAAGNSVPVAGTVEFYRVNGESETLLGTAELEGNTASLGINGLLAPGFHSVRARYVGVAEGGFSPSVSETIAIQILEAPELTLTLPPLGAVRNGSELSFSAHVNTSGGGTLVVTLGGTQRYFSVGESGAVTGTIPVAYLVGETSLDAVFYPRSSLVSAVSASQTITVLPAPTTTTIVSAPRHVNTFTQLLYRVRVESVPGAGTPNGEVELLADGAVVANGYLNGQGIAEIYYTPFSAGDFVITARYGSYFAGPWEPSLSEPAPLSVSFFGLAATTTFPDAPSTSVTIGNPATLTARVSDELGGMVASGRVTFETTDERGVVRAIGHADVGSDGQATLVYTPDSLGTFAVRMRYSGADGFAASEATTVLYVVPATTVVRLSLANGSYTEVARGSQVPLSAEVLVAGSDPQGTVDFYDGDILLGSASVEGRTAHLQATFGELGFRNAIRAVYRPAEGPAVESQPISLLVYRQVFARVIFDSPVLRAGQPATYSIEVVDVFDGSPVSAGTVYSLGTGLVTIGQGYPVPQGGRITGLTVTPTQIGSFPAVAYYVGDELHRPTFEVGEAVEVLPAETLTSLTISPAVPYANRPITFNVTVTSPSIFGNPQVGQIEIVREREVQETIIGEDGTEETVTRIVYENLAVFQLGPDGTASHTLAGLPVGEYRLAARFVPVGNRDGGGGGPAIASRFDEETTSVYGSSMSAPLALQLNELVEVETSTTLSITPTVVNPGQPFNFDIQVSGPGGAPITSGEVRIVNVSNGNEVIAASSLNATGRATFALSLPSGRYDLKAVYVPSGVGFRASESDIQSVQVRFQTVTTATVVNPTVPFGQQATVRVQVSSPNGIPSGRIQILRDGAHALDATLDAQGRFEGSFGPGLPGQHTVTVRYLGDDNFGPSESRPASYEVQKVSTVTNLRVTPGVITLGQSVTLTADVDANRNLSGEVEFYNGDTLLGRATLDRFGEASITFTPTAAGSNYAFNARYLGTSLFEASRSGNTPLTVRRAASQTSLVLQPSSVTYGDSTELIATIRSGPGGSTPTPTGFVDFLQGETLILRVELDANGVARLPHFPGAAGTYSIVARYEGNVNYEGNEASATLTVAPARVLVDLQAPSTATAGRRFPVFVQLSSNAGTPQGEVELLRDGTVFATLQVGEHGAAGRSVTLPEGEYVLTARYVGSRDYGAATSSPVRITVSRISTVTTLDVTPLSAPYGSPIRFEATVSARNEQVTGDVGFFHGETLLGTATLDAMGKAVLTRSDIPVGVYTDVTARFVGDTTFAPSRSQAAAFAVTPAATRTTVALERSEIRFGESVDVTATVSSVGGDPEGTVEFLVDGNVVGRAMLDDSGRAVFTVSGLEAGSYTVSARYATQGNFGASASDNAQLTVQPAQTTTVLTADPASIRLGESTRLTARVTSPAGTPGGVVEFRNGGALLGTATLAADGTATLSFTPTAAGRYDGLKATYQGERNYATSSGTTTLDVARASAAVALAVDPSVTTYGNDVVLTATVTSSAGTPGGTVEFRNGQSVLGTATLDASGVARLRLTRPDAGTYTLDARYLGDQNYAAAESASASLTVRPASTASTLEVAPSTITYGENAVLRVRVTSDAGVPGGTVQIVRGTTVLGVVTLDANGEGRLELNRPDAGVYDGLQASYTGSRNFASSLSGEATLTVRQAPTETSLAVSPSPTAREGEAVTLTATVRSQAGVPGGLVEFRNGELVLGRALLDAQGTATLTLTQLPPGTYAQLNARYVGERNFAASVSLPSALVVQARPNEPGPNPNPGPVTVATATALSVSPSTIQQGESALFTVVVRGQNGEVPRGIVELRVGSGVLARVVLDANGVATFRLTGAPSGTYNVVAVYLGSEGYTASFSAPVTLQVTPRPFSIDGLGLFLAPDWFRSPWLVTPVAPADVRPVLPPVVFDAAKVVPLPTIPVGGGGGSVGGGLPGELTLEELWEILLRRFFATNPEAEWWHWGEDEELLRILQERFGGVILPLPKRVPPSERPATERNNGENNTSERRDGQTESRPAPAPERTTPAPAPAPREASRPAQPPTPAVSPERPAGGAPTPPAGANPAPAPNGGSAPAPGNGGGSESSGSSGGSQGGNGQ